MTALERCENSQREQRSLAKKAVSAADRSCSRRFPRAINDFPREAARAHRLRQTALVIVRGDHEAAYRTAIVNGERFQRWCCSAVIEIEAH